MRRLRAGALYKHIRMSAPLLDRQRAPVARTKAAHKALRRYVATSVANSRAGSLYDPGRPSLKEAVAFNRFFLPKDADGKLLPLGSGPLSLGLGREADYEKHVGSGVVGGSEHTHHGWSR